MKEGIFITKISFKIDGEPKGKGRPRFGKGSTYTPTETKDYLLQLYQGIQSTVDESTEETAE